ncbi:hypothetical protein ACFQDG_05355, partial [Natronoarchaeum mannanilyticum]
RDDERRLWRLSDHDASTAATDGSEERSESQPVERGGGFHRVSYQYDCVDPSILLEDRKKYRENEVADQSSAGAGLSPDSSACFLV